MKKVARFTITEIDRHHSVEHSEARRRFRVQKTWADDAEVDLDGDQVYCLECPWLNSGEERQTCRHAQAVLRALRSGRLPTRPAA